MSNIRNQDEYKSGTFLGVRFKQEDYNLLRKKYPNTSRLIRFLVNAVLHEDQEIINKIEELTHSRIDKLAVYDERDLNAIAWAQAKAKISRE